MSCNIKSYDSLLKELDEVVAKLNSKQREDTTNYCIWRNEEYNPYCVQYCKIEVYTRCLQWTPTVFSEDTLYNTVIKVFEYLRSLDEL